jgi:hypothetical protein
MEIERSIKSLTIFARDCRTAFRAFLKYIFGYTAFKSSYTVDRLHPQLRQLRTFIVC